MVSVKEIKSIVDRDRSYLLELLEKIVNIDSGTEDKEGVDALGDLLAEEIRGLGFQVNVIKEESLGNHLIAHNVPSERPKVLLVGHMDTVYPRGTAKKRPFTMRNGKAFGPGVLDMKGGIVVMIAALRALRDAGSRVLKDTSITIFLNSDEEILSPSSMHMIDAEASTSDLAVVFEPARPGGGYVRSRWGVARCLVKVYGRAGHAGWVSSGVAAGSAIHELVRRISEVLGYAEKRGDVLLNVGVVRGGERFNVVAPYAEAEIGVRSPSLESLKRAVSDMNNIFARVQDIEGVRTEFHVMSMWPPLIETERNRDALKHFERAANELGRSLGVEDTSGASDANHISQYTAVVDGAGAVGGNPHSPDEYIDIDRTLERAVITARALEIYYEHAKEMVRG